jgi:hypothetical protein
MISIFFFYSVKAYFYILKIHIQGRSIYIYILSITPIFIVYDFFLINIMLFLLICCCYLLEIQYVIRYSHIYIVRYEINKEIYCTEFLYRISVQ